MWISLLSQTVVGQGAFDLDSLSCRSRVRWSFWSFMKATDDTK